jgi:hypothetical protein
MYKVQPRGINIKDNERNVQDGFLKESINLQWKDGSYRPIPERLETTFPNTTETTNNIIFHKVSDEDQINLLAFTSNGLLIWRGIVIDGEQIQHQEFIHGFPRVTDFESLSFTILNGLIYFMNISQEFYYRLQYNETTEEYEVKDMYAWKSLIPYYPITGSYSGLIPMNGDTHVLVTQCGIILIRFTLVLNTGEEVLHTPIYPYYMFSVNTGTSNFSKGDALTNIHTLINTNLDFEDVDLLEDEVSAINIYASTPYYITENSEDTTLLANARVFFTGDNVKGEVQKLSEEPFYLVKTIQKPGTSLTNENVLFFVGEIDSELGYVANEYSKVDVNTIAAGLVMPIDNFSYHKIFGKITSNNGLLIVSKPKTVLSIGHIRALSLNKSPSRVGFHINTEDGDLEGIFEIDTEINVLFGTSFITSRGILSYPDSRASYVGANASLPNPVLLYKTRANKAHNMSCAFNFSAVSNSTLSAAIIGTNFEWGLKPSANIIYGDADKSVLSIVTDPIFYTSENRLQFSESGEFSVWPAINSYRVGEGRIMFVGSNSVDPTNADYIAPLMIGTSDGVYTVNFNPTGITLIQSITRTVHLPVLSENNVLIDQNLIYVSDKGLIIINDGKPINITKDYFPEYGNGDFPDNNTTYPNYDLLTANLSGNDYQLTDIVDYMKGALFAFDGRRDNVWCSNPDKNFSLIFNLKTKQWTMSTYVFSEVIDFNSILNTDEGEVYSRYLVRSESTFDILSGEDMSQKVYTHLLTRSIKIQNPDQYKKIQRLISRCELYRDDSNGYFTFGLWGKQDLNKNKVNIPLIAYNDNSNGTFPNNIRQDIPVGRMKGKYKIITILQGGFILPSSSLDNFEITAIPVENNILR